MKAVIAVAVAAAFALPAFAQQKSDTKAEPKLPTAEERAKNRETVGKGASNAALTTKVKSALAKDAGFKTLGKIDVDSNEGVVTLKGRVESADAKKKAEQIAKQVDGVKSVKNQLRVEAGKKEKS
jgi:hyperosmotically inducible periplasmic protein